MQFFLGVLTTLAVFVLGGVLFVYSGVYDVAATEDHTAVGQWALHQTMHNSVAARTDDIEVPKLSDDAMVKRGAQAYDALCAACHLKPGQDSSLIRTGLNPTPPALAEGGHHDSARQFWIIKNGIRMTGMPAWGPTHDDEALWEIIAFLKELPGLSEDEYAQLVQPTKGQDGIANDGHDHDHGDMQAMMNGGGHHDSPLASGHAGGDSETHGEPGHHDSQGEASPKAMKASSAEEDDHYADGHTH